MNIQPDEFIEKWRPLKNCRKNVSTCDRVNSSSYMKKLTADGSEVISIHLTGGMRVQFKLLKALRKW
ncbi:hypothetical protein ACEQPO_16670 [Bacillus sp. SL00103]